LGEYDVPDEVLGVTGAYLGNLYVAMSPVGDSSSTHLELYHHKETDEYRRMAVVSPADIAKKSDYLRRCSKYSEMFISKEDADLLGHEWLFYELSADILGNSVFMQNRYERYINDTNVQAGFDANFRVVKMFLESYADEFDRTDLEVQQTALKFGLALELMPDAIVRKGVTENLKKAEWMINGIRSRDDYPNTFLNGDIRIRPLSSDEIVGRLATIQAKPAFQEAAEYANRLPTLEDDYDFSGDNTPSSGIVYPIRR